MNFFDTKNFPLRREVIKRFLGTDPSKQTTSVKKTNFLQCLYRGGDKGTRGTHVELQLLIYNYLLIGIFTPTQ